MKILSSLVLGVVGIVVAGRVVVDLLNGGQLVDFRVYYATASYARQAKDFYQQSAASGWPFLYPAPVIWWFTPLTYFPVQAAEILWTLLSLGLLAMTIIVWGRWWGWSWLQVTGWGSLMLLAFPVRFTLGMGQINHLTLGLLAAGVLLVLLGRPVPGAVGLVLGWLSKGVAWVWWLVLIWKRQARIALLTVSLLGALLTLAVGVWGLEWVTSYVWLALERVSGLSGKAVYYNQALSGLVTRYWGTGQVAQVWYWLGTVGIVVGSVIAMWRKTLIQGLLIALTANLLIQGITWQHHLVWLILPLMWLAQFGRRPYWLLFAGGLWWMNIPDPQLWTGWSSVVLSHGFWSVFIVWLLLLFPIDHATKKTPTNS